MKTDDISTVFKTVATLKKIAEQDTTPTEVRELLKITLMTIRNLMTENETYREKMEMTSKVRDLYRGRSEVETNELVELIKDVQEYLSNEMAETYILADIDEEKADLVRKSISNYVKRVKPMIEIQDSPTEKARQLTEEELIDFLFREIRGFSVLEEAMKDGSIEEIQINDYNDIRYIIGGREEKSGTSFRSPEHLRLFADKLTRVAGLTGQTKSLSKDNPFVRLRIGDTTRVSMMGSPFARRGGGISDGEVIHMAIRKQRDKPFDRNFLLNVKSISSYGDNLLKVIFSSGVSVAGYGSTGTGKTAMVRRYLSEIPDDRRVITLAEIDEMNLRKVEMNKYIINPETGMEEANPNLYQAVNSAIMWECPDLEQVIQGNLKGFSGLINAALTFSPETIVLQESKSGEIKDVIEGAISGHQVVTTLHASSPSAFFLRLLLMYQQAAANISDHLILAQIPEAFPIIVAFKRYPDGSRKISEITELLGYNTERNIPITNTLLKYVHESTYYDDKLGKLVMTGNFYAGKKFLSQSTIDRMKDGGVEDEVLQALRTEWSNTPQMDFNSMH